ncbi:hypothetical protein BC834DRAFT_852251 [Gloeopeniophorella convolvens]|nr:hypothetical protein BC834DRAFT_852251 [Gloeopeniophorella convolvens]
MSDNADTKPSQRPPPPEYQVALDERYYDILGEEELAFFKVQTGIQDEVELKAHLLQMQAEAYAVYPYPCIRRFSWARLKISRFPAYQDLLKLGRERKGAIFLDIGSCFGNDARKAVADGFPLENVITSDLRERYGELGHRLFRTTPETYPIAFIAGDAFEPQHLEIVPPFTTANAPTGPAPDLRSLTSLNPLHGRTSAIHASAFFHLFDEEQQLHLARALAGLLSPEPGSIMFGAHGGRHEKGFRERLRHGEQVFCHSPESWSELWNGQVFEQGTVKVEVTLVQVERRILPEGVDDEVGFQELMIWSVTRL